MTSKSSETLLRNVSILSKLTELETGMMPATEAPLPSVRQVAEIVDLVKSIIFPDYFNKRQTDETVRSYNIGVNMEQLLGLLVKQIAHGLQFCEDCENISSKAEVYAEAERLATEFIDTLPEIKRLIIVTSEGKAARHPEHPEIELIPIDVFLLKGLSQS